MNGKDDLLNDILPMVIYRILDPKYISGEDEDEDKTGEENEKASNEDNEIS